MTVSSLISDRAFDDALRSLGLSAPTASRGRDDARSALGQLCYRIMRRMMDVLCILSSKRTLQPEHVLNLSAMVLLLATPVAQSSPAPGGVRYRARSGDAAMPLMRGGHGGTVFPGAYYSGVESPQFSAGNVGSFTPSFPDTVGGNGMVRFEQSQSEAFGADNAQSNLMMTGGGHGVKAWLSDEAVDAMLREYGSRSGPVRVSAGARGLLRSMVESNASSALQSASKGAPKPSYPPQKGGKKRPVTATLISKVGDTMRVSV